MFYNFLQRTKVPKMGLFGQRVSRDEWRWGAEEEKHVEKVEKKPCRQQKYRQRTVKEANVSKDRLINETIRSDGIKTNK